MPILAKTLQSLAIIFAPLFFSLLLTSCSGDDSTDINKYDHPHDKTIDMKKHLFEHEFAQQCIITESANLVHKETGHERFAKSCLCIATYLFKDLETQESYALLNDKKQAQSLRNKYKDATDHCL